MEKVTVEEGNGGTVLVWVDMALSSAANLSAIEVAWVFAGSSRWATLVEG